MTWIPVFAGMTMLLAACGGHPGNVDAGCILPGQRPMIVAELFFGRFIPGRAPLSEAEWRVFAAEIVTPNFPDGFTTYEAEGQWRNPATGTIAREPVKVLLVAALPGPDFAPRLSAVIEAYKTRFRQQSVGITTHQSCAAF
ncbi:MAG: DUF3574 domain-containing protein [Alphaproteobacteria bacterium]